LVILAGSSSSDSGGNKRVGALNVKGSFSDSASVRAVTYVNAEQAPKTGIAGADPPPLKGKATVAADRGMIHDPRGGPAGVWATARRKRKPTQSRENLIGDLCRST